MSSEHDMHVRSRTVLIVEDEPRLQDMLSHALDEVALQRLVAQLGELGVQASARELNEGEHLMGWGLGGRR